LQKAGEEEKLIAIDDLAIFFSDMWRDIRENKVANIITYFEIVSNQRCGELK
jgi:hypothetical protein